MADGSIAEYVVDDADYSRLLEELHRDSTDRIQKLAEAYDVRKYRQVVLATLGATDIVDIRLYPDVSQLAVQATTPAYGSRRWAGIRRVDAPAPGPEQPPDARVEWTLPDADPGRPLFAVMHLNMSPILRFCAAYRHQNACLEERLAGRLFRAGAPLWAQYDEIREASALTGPEVTVTPFYGSDAADYVVLVRAGTVADIAALAWSFRHLTIGGQGMNVDGTCAETCAAIAPGATALTSAHVANDAVFVRTTTVVGFELERVTRATQVEGANWRLPVPADSSSPVERVLVGLSFDARHPVDPAADDLLLNDTRKGTDPYEFEVLFDRSDLRRQTVNRGGADSTLGDLLAQQARTLGIANDASRSPPSPSARTRTQISARISVPYTVFQQKPGCVALQRFRTGLRACRTSNLEWDEVGSWTHDLWTTAKKIGTDYPSTAGALQLANAVVSHTEDDVESFVDLLPVLRELCRPTPATETGREGNDRLRWLFQIAIELAAGRRRRDNPLRVPGQTFEGPIANRMAANAFATYARSVGRAFGRSLVLTLETPGSRTLNESGSPMVDALRVSPLVLQQPVHWVHAHEVGHGVARQVIDADHPALLALWDAVRVVDPRRKLEIVKASTVHDLAWDLLCPTLGKFAGLKHHLLAQVSAALRELMPDLVLWHSLTPEAEDPEERERRFWFLYGPGIVREYGMKYGAGRPSHEDEPVSTLLRLFFISWVTRESADSPEDGWWPACQRFADALVDGSPSSGLPAQAARRATALLRDLSAIETGAPDTREAFDARYVQEIKEKLDTWVGRLFGLPAQHIELIGRWLQLVRQVTQESFKPSAGRQDEARLAFGRYIGDLARKWGPHLRDDWLPHIPGHFRGQKQPVVFSRRGGIFGQRDIMDGYLEGLLRVQADLDEICRIDRYVMLREYMSVNGP